MPFSFFRKVKGLALSDGGSLKSRVVRSGLWVGLSDALLAVLGFIRSVILARLLSPEIFGLMGLAQTATSAIETFTRPGVGEALIVRQQSFDEARSTAFTLLVARGVMLSVLVALAAPWVARFYETEALVPLLQALAAVFVLKGLENVNTIAKRRELEFRKLTYLSQATTWTAFVVTVAAAFWLRSVWALVIGQLASVAFGTLLSYLIIGGRPSFAFRSAIARELLSYGKFITGASIVLFIASQIDLVMIGKLLGAEQLGFYALAFTVTQLLTTTLSKAVSAIMMPAYSKLQTDLAALRNAFLRTVSLVMYVVLPATAGMVLVAGPLIEVVYGAQWLPAVLPMRILAIFGLFMSLVALNGYLFQGMGVPSIAFKLGILRLALIAALLAPMIRWYGIAGAGYAVTIGIFVHWITGTFFLHRHLSVLPAQLWSAIRRPMLTTLVMALPVGALIRLVPASPAILLCAAALVGVIVYAALNWSVFRALAKEFHQLGSR